MNHYKLFFYAMSLALIITFFACSDDDDDNNGTGPSTVELTQADLNSSTNPIEMDLTGTTFGDATVPHNAGASAGNHETFRDVYSSITDLANITEGTVITKRVYFRDNDGNKGELSHTFAMVKREAGYDAANNDWEYFVIPFDATTDYIAMPNGDLSKAAASGKLENCINCHTNDGNGNYLFLDEVASFVLTQEHLNNSNKEIDLGVTGDKYGAGAVGHNGMDPDPNATIRDVYADRSEYGTIPLGTVVTKKVYLKNPDGTKGDLQVTFAMVKREDGYDPDNANWEYFMMPFDQSVDYNAMPLGDITKAAASGKLDNCISCHAAAAGGDFLFTNDL